jgi:hypothetical protein
MERGHERNSGGPKEAYSQGFSILSRLGRRPGNLPVALKKLKKLEKRGHGCLRSWIIAR